MSVKGQKWWVLLRLEGGWDFDSLQVWKRSQEIIFPMLCTIWVGSSYLRRLAFEIKQKLGMSVSVLRYGEEKEMEFWRLRSRSCGVSMSVEVALSKLHLIKIRTPDWCNIQFFRERSIREAVGPWRRRAYGVVGWLQYAGLFWKLLAELFDINFFI